MQILFSRILNANEGYLTLRRVQENKIIQIIRGGVIRFAEKNV